MAVTINTMKENYLKHDDIEKELASIKLENYLDFDRYGSYTFAHCGTCGGPNLGHIEVKCSHLNNARYDKVIIEGFEDWLKSFKGFRQAVLDRYARKKREETEERV
jgi:hypothetical protein